MARHLRVNPTATSPIGFIHVDDAVRALQCATQMSGESVYANAVGEALSVRSVAITVREAAATRSLKTTIDPEPKPEVAEEAFHVSTVLGSVGWKPSELMINRVGEIIDYFRPGGTTP